MQIKSLTLKNFRNHKNLNLEFREDFVVFFGPNATGKTNLLESLYFLSIFKSFRDASNYLFSKGTFNLELHAVIEKGGRDHLLEIFLENRSGKIFANFKLDGVRKARKLVQNFLRAVIFDPTDVDLMNKPSDQRRRYLNMILSQNSPKYMEDLYNYKKVITQKNQLLYNIKSGRSSIGELATWNEQQAYFGSEIIATRKEYVNYLNQSISEIYAAVSGFSRPIEVEYKTVNGDSKHSIAANFKKDLFENQEREIATATSVIGPHRDDFTLISDGIYLTPFSSRGELRSQVLALKILELEYLTRENDRPILLLDDVLSELDEDRRVYLLKYLKGKYQTFITSTVPVEMQAQHVALREGWVTPASENTAAN